MLFRNSDFRFLCDLFVRNELVKPVSFRCLVVRVLISVFLCIGGLVASEL